MTTQELKVFDATSEIFHLGEGIFLKHNGDYVSMFDNSKQNFVTVPENIFKTSSKEYMLSLCWNLKKIK